MAMRGSVVQREAQCRTSIIGETITASSGEPSRDFTASYDDLGDWSGLVWVARWAAFGLDTFLDTNPSQDVRNQLIVLYNFSVRSEPKSSASTSSATSARPVA